METLFLHLQAIFTILLFTVVSKIISVTGLRSRPTWVCSQDIL